VKITAEKVDSLLKGYRQEYPFLIDFLNEELSKERPSKEIVEKTEFEIYLYDLLFETVMSLNYRYRIPLISHYFSKTPKTYDQVAAEMGVWTSTHSRRLKEGKKRVLALMNAKLEWFEKNKKPEEA